MTRLVRVIHVFLRMTTAKTWMARIKRAMTDLDKHCRRPGFLCVSAPLREQSCYNLSMHIHRASEDDWQEIAEIFLAARRTMTYLNAGLHSDAETRLFIRRMVKRSEVWLAEQGGEIIGFAATEPAPHQSWLHHLYVDPAAHNAGAGSLLLAKAKEEMPRGFSLWTFQANLGARRFYERHGLTETRRTRGTENEEGLPDILYEWRP